MRKKLLLVMVLALALFTWPGCGAKDFVEGVKEGVKGGIEEARQVITGNVKGEIGKSYSTKWFDFTIKSIRQADEYDGFEPDEGYIFVVVKIKETGAWDEAVPLGTYDFYMDADNFEDLIWPVDPLNDDMMPLDFFLEKGESAEYDMVFVIPADSSNLKLIYTEVDEQENEGTTFTINVKL